MTRRSLALRIALALAALALPSTVSATDYYVSAAGADANSGTSPAAAWRTVQRVNNQHFVAGDRVLFEGGQTFSGSLYFDSSELGTRDQPITITSYGSGRATIYPGDGTGILLYNTAGYVITDLYVVGSGRTTNTGSGVFAYTDLPDNAKLDYLTIQRVDAVRFGEAGVQVGSNNGQAGFRHVRIDHVIASDNGKQGIFTYAAFANSHEDVYIGYSLAFNNSGFAGLAFNSGNGITLSGVNGGMIERSVSHDNGWLCDAGNGPIGIWTYSSNNIVIQYNESYNNKTGGTKDGGGYSLDNDTSNSVLQYNYSHGNTGAGYQLAHKPDNLVHSGNVVRYNISENDGRRNDYAAIQLWGRIRNAEIYNNTVYIASTPSGTPGAPRAVLIKNSSIPTHDLASVHFRNNIIVTKSVVAVEVTADQIDGMTDLKFQNNVYYASGGTAKFNWGGTIYAGLSAWRTASGQEVLNGANVGSETNPLLRSVGGGVTFNDATLLDRLEGYRLGSGSPAIDAGLALTAFGVSPGGVDYYGTSLPQYAGYDIGAHELGVDCYWTIGPSATTMPAAGGTSTVQVQTTATCGWSATPKVDWLYVVGDATGRGNGTVTIGATANPLSTSRTGTVVIGLNTYTVQQAPGTAPNVPPTVAITAPGNGAIYPSGSTVTIAASASDSDGTVAGVDFLVNAGPVGSDSSDPYSFTWTPPSDGTYTLTARAVDNAGATTTSAAVTITVGTPPAGALPSPWTSSDIGSVGVAGSATYDAGTFAVTGSGTDIWGTADAFRFVYQPMSGDGSIVARVATVQAVDAWTKAGVMIRDSLSAGAKHATMFVSSAKGLAFQRRTATGGVSTNTGTTGAAPMWIRMTRAGTTFTAAWSTNGTTWTTLGTDTITMGSTVYVGLAVTSHNNAQAARATFDNVAVSVVAPPPSDTWAHQDIGSVGLAGSATQSGASATVKGAGADIWGTADAFHFLYRHVSGDGEIIARVTGVTNTNAWAKAGVMIRASTSSGAAHASMFVSYGKGLAFQRRPTSGGTSVSTPGSASTAPMWVRMVREGSIFRAYESADGVTWTQVGSETITMPADALWGLAVTSHNTAALCTATFDNVSVRP